MGKPSIKGTRISVELILDLLSSGWSESDILESYPHLTQENMKAVCLFKGVYGIEQKPHRSSIHYSTSSTFSLCLPTCTIT